MRECASAPGARSEAHLTVELSRYFFPKFSRNDSERTLEGRTSGTFLFRSSSSQLNALVLSIKQRRGVLHILIRYNPSNSTYTIDSRGKQTASSLYKQAFNSLESITRQLKERRLLGAGVVNAQHVSRRRSTCGGPESAKLEGMVPSLGEQGKRALQEVLGRKSVLDEYVMMVRVYIMDEALSPTELKHLAEYRKRAKIDQKMHREALSELKISEALWEKYTQKGSVLSDTSEAGTTKVSSDFVAASSVEKGEKKDMKSRQIDPQQPPQPAPSQTETVKRQDYVDISAAAPQKPPNEWTEEDVLAWLTTAGPKHKIKTKTVDKLRGEDIDGEALLALDRPMLMQLGITMGQSNAVYKAIRSLTDVTS